MGFQVRSDDGLHRAGVNTYCGRMLVILAPNMGPCSCASPLPPCAYSGQNNTPHMRANADNIEPKLMVITVHLKNRRSAIEKKCAHSNVALYL